MIEICSLWFYKPLYEAIYEKIWNAVHAHNEWLRTSQDIQTQSLVGSRPVRTEYLSAKHESLCWRHNCCYIMKFHN